MELPRSRRLSDKAYTYIVQETMPEETALSLPVYFRRDSRLMVAFFGAIAVPLPDFSNSDVYRPVVRIDVDWETGEVAGHQLAPVVVPVERDRPVGRLLPDDLAGSLTEEQGEAVAAAFQEAYHLLDEVAPLYTRAGLSTEERETVARCRRAYSRLVHPDLWPYYETLNPDFFQWLTSPPEATSNVCPTCGTTNPAGSRFCNQCGAKLVG